MDKTTRYFFLFLILFIPHFTQCQTFYDTLKSKTYTELEGLYSKYDETDTLKARKIASIYLEKAKKDKDTFKIAEGYFYQYEQIGGFNKIPYLDSIISITTNKQNQLYPSSAYLKKAQFYFMEERNVESTLTNLNEAQKYAKSNKNPDLTYRINYFMGVVRSEHLGEKKKAIRIFKDCAEFYKNETEEDHKFRYLYALHSIAETYIGLKKYDSASYFNKLGYSRASIASDPEAAETTAYFTLCEGINHYERKRFKATIDSAKIALPSMLALRDKSNVIDSYFYLGQSYYNLDDKENAIFYFKKTDSILESLNSIPQYKHVKTYQYLKEYYKSKNDLINQNKYLDKLNTILDNYLNDQIFISRKVKEDYDIPVLLEEQQVLIKKLNKDTNTYQSSIVILILLLFGLGGILFYQHKRKQVYRQRFEALIAENKPVVTPKHQKIEHPTKESKKLEVPEKHVTYILEKLDEFEKEKKYLSIGISSQSLADDMETNIKYLSKVINYYKNKTFTNYLNELRISYAVEELKANATLRKFTIKAIANEMGYNSAETFSNAFYKQVKIKPSYFIKNLNKNK